MLDDADLHALAARLVAVAGVVGVTLGGSRAREQAHVDSDVDLGLYYRPGLDLDALGALAREVAGPDTAVTAPGGWEPWVDGGAWLNIAGLAMDWIYRALARARASWTAAQRGAVDFYTKVGHPLGVAGFAYAGEIALARVLADPTGELGALHQQARTYPPALREALVQRLWEADFLLSGATKITGRGDATYVAGCVFRVVGLCAHALCAHTGRWLINEKGAIAAARLPAAPPGFEDRAHHLLGHLDTTATELGRACTRPRCWLTRCAPPARESQHNSLPAQAAAARRRRPSTSSRRSAVDPRCGTALWHQPVGPRD